MIEIIRAWLKTALDVLVVLASLIGEETTVGGLEFLRGTNVSKNRIYTEQNF